MLRTQIIRPGNCLRFFLAVPLWFLAGRQAAGTLSASLASARCSPAHNGEAGQRVGLGEFVFGAPIFLSLRRNSAGAFGNQPVVLDPAVLGEIEHRLLVETADVEIAFGGEHLIGLGGRQRDDLS